MMHLESMNRAVVLALAALFCYPITSSSSKGPGASEAGVKIAENPCWPKGGLGIISTNLYVDLLSTDNELVLPNGERWIGLAAREKQVVLVADGRVTSGTEIWPGFRLEVSSIVSYEEDKILFFDFSAGKGGFYQRRLD
jgi:hypothetical protein